MRNLRVPLACLALPLIGVAFACSAAQEERPDAVPIPPFAEVANPMASFARLLTGEWRVTLLSGTSMFRTWHWGPDRRSIRGMTRGSGAAGEPWHALHVFYWHPGRQEVCLLGLSPYAESVSEGTVRFEGDIVDAQFDCYQTEGRREMGRRWIFDGPDKYRETLWDAGQPPMGEWEFIRSPTLTVPHPRTGEAAPELSEHLKVFEPLLGHTWETQRDATTGVASHLRSTVEWIPYAEGIYVRTAASTAGDEPTHVLDAYVYRHTGTGALRCLALSKQDELRDGGVYEGEVTVLQGGAVQIELDGYAGDQVVPHVVRIDFGTDGTLRQRVWSVAGAERRLELDVHHEKL